MTTLFFKHFIRCSAFLIPLFFVSALTPANADETAKAKAEKERTCIYVRNINGFSPIDKKHLTVSVGARQTYLVTLFSRCHELRWAESIAIKATNSWTCTSSRDKLIVDGEICYITSIRKVSDRAEALDIVDPDRNNN